jgi:hypothetical protein
MGTRYPDWVGAQTPLKQANKCLPPITCTPSDGILFIFNSLILFSCFSFVLFFMLSCIYLMFQIVEFISVLLTIGSETAEKELIRQSAIKRPIDLFSE